LEPERICALVILGILHWMLAFILLDDMTRRQQMRRRHKAPWVILIVSLVFIGSLVYLLCHPGFFYGNDDDQT